MNRNDSEFHPDNTISTKPKPWCYECNGAHEPSGARSDCIRYWRKLAHDGKELVEWAQSLLCSATPNGKLLSEEKSREWCEGFGKWFAESNEIAYKPFPLDPDGSILIVGKWVESGRYRRLCHRHDGGWVAADESVGLYVAASTIGLLGDELMNWPTSGKPIGEQKYVKVSV